MRYMMSANLLAVGIAVFSLSTPAHALDGTDLINKLNAALGFYSGMGIVAASITIEDSNITLSDSRFEFGKGLISLPLGTLKLEGVEENSGSYAIDRLSFEDVTLVQKSTMITASDLSISGIHIPANMNGDTIDAVLLYEQASTGPVEIKIDGKSAISIGSYQATNEVTGNRKSMTSKVRVANLKADIEILKNPYLRQMAGDLGIGQIDGSISMVSKWDTVSGTLTIEKYALDFANIGRLNIAYSLSGYTLDFLRLLDNAAKKVAAIDDPELFQTIAANGPLLLVQQLSVNSAKIRFDDGGIATKLLNIAAKKQGISGDQLAQMIETMGPVMVAQYGMPELQMQVSEALNAYLDAPGSFTISAKPDQAVRISKIVHAVEALIYTAAPNTIPQMLGVTVTAND